MRHRGPVGSQSWCVDVAAVRKGRVGVLHNSNPDEISHHFLSNHQIYSCKLQKMLRGPSKNDVSIRYYELGPLPSSPLSVSHPLKMVPYFRLKAPPTDIRASTLSHPFPLPPG